MSAAIRAVTLILALAIAGCASESDQNVLITNEIPANADVEVLPPDESVATPTDERADGAIEPDSNEATADAR